ncbi:MAG: hypothetical protein DYG89_24160 [Caldilinea sp. CFX5]|nr:hypothetical protein [Caldilinea sp. CFX5]
MGNLDLDKSQRHDWTVIGSPSPGTVTALAVGLRESVTLFAGTRVGLYQTKDLNQDTQPHWRRMPNAPVEIIALAVSPSYDTDSTMLAGTGQGLFFARDRGEKWQRMATPMPAPVVLCLAFSPNYKTDGLILAGTLEDGIYYSDNRGERWSYRGFGLLDGTVYTLAFSPDFARDETIFAGTETALYYSYNGGRAWKQLDFPEEAAPILSLAVSPHFAQDQTLYAGTEQQGLYQSVDQGQSWERVDLPATSINMLVTTDRGLFAATNTGLYSFGHDSAEPQDLQPPSSGKVGGDDGVDRTDLPGRLPGEHWRCLLAQPDAFALAEANDVLLASLVNQGAWLTHDQTHWQPCFTLPARLLTGMALAPHFDIDPVAFLYSAQEGIWRTTDGGHSWSCLNARLPDLAIQAVALSPHFHQDRTLLAASSDGLLYSADAGDHWASLMTTPLTHVTFSSSGNLVAVASTAGEIQVADTVAGPWRTLPSAWGEPGNVLVLTVSDDARLCVAIFDPTSARVSIWQGQGGHWQRLLTQPASARPIASLWQPPADQPDQAWYASVDDQVWAIGGSADATLYFTTADGNKILHLVGSHAGGDSPLFVCTAERIYQATGVDRWTVAHEFGDERMVALALASSTADKSTAYALLLGGAFCRGPLP